MTDEVAQDRYLWRLLERARHPVGPATITPFTKPGMTFPRYPTGIPAVDGQTGGGGYGLTAVVGEPKAKKSVLASNMAAIEACRQGWQVRVLQFELSRTETLHRAAAYLQVPTLVDAPPWMYDRWKVLDCTDPESMDHTVTRLQESLPLYDADRLLVVVDSVSRFADDAPGDYFGNLRSMWGFLRRLVKLSEGAIGCIGVVEINHKGTDRGGNAGYACNMMLRLTREEDGLVEISMPYSRETAIPKPMQGRKAGSFGKFALQPERWRLAQWEEVGRTPIMPDDPGEEF